MSNVSSELLIEAACEFRRAQVNSLWQLRSLPAQRRVEVGSFEDLSGSSRVVVKEQGQRTAGGRQPSVRQGHGVEVVGFPRLGVAAFQFMACEWPEAGCARQSKRSSTRG